MVMRISYKYKALECKNKGIKMKKIVLSSVLAMGLLSTAATAEIKVGLGYDLDLAGAGTTTLRIPVDGLVAGLRVEPIFSMVTNNSAAATPVVTKDMTIGVAAYYDIMTGISAGLSWTSVAAQTVDDVISAANSSTSSIALLVKGEEMIGKNLSIAFELGYATNTNQLYTVADTKDTYTSGSLAPVAAVTARLFF